MTKKTKNILKTLTRQTLDSTQFNNNFCPSLRTLVGVKEAPKFDKISFWWREKVVVVVEGENNEEGIGLAIVVIIPSSGFCWVV